MKKFFEFLWNCFKPIVGLVYSFEEKKIKVAVLILNIISIYMLWLLNDVHNYLKMKAATASEFGTSFTTFLTAYLGVYITMILSIYHGKNSTSTTTAIPTGQQIVDVGKTIINTVTNKKEEKKEDTTTSGQVLK